MLLIYRIRRKRPALRLIISSATLDATAVLNYFKQGDSEVNVTIISLEGRTYSVEIAHLQDPVPDYIRKAVDTVWSIHLRVSCVSLNCHNASATDFILSKDQAIYSFS